MDRNYFSPGFTPGPHDVIIGRHQKLKESHQGNLKLKALTDSFLEEYKRSAEDKKRKSDILAEIYAKIHADGGIFVKLDSKSQQFYEAEKSVAREGISQGFRDLLKDQYRSSLSFKKNRRMIKEGRITAVDDSITEKTTIGRIPDESPAGVAKGQELSSKETAAKEESRVANKTESTTTDTTVETMALTAENTLDTTDPPVSTEPSIPRDEPQPQENAITSSTKENELGGPDMQNTATDPTNIADEKKPDVGVKPAPEEATNVKASESDIAEEASGEGTMPVDESTKQSEEQKHSDDAVPVSRRVNKAVVPKKTTDVPFLPRDGVLLLDADYEPHDNDVIVGLRRKSAEHPGNQNLVKVVQGFLDEYKAAGNNKNLKSICLNKVSQVMADVDPPAKFVKLEPDHKNWYELEVFYAREKISQTFRDIAKEGYRSAITNKNERRRRAKAMTAKATDDDNSVAKADKSKRKMGPPKKRAIRAHQGSAASTSDKTPGSASKLAKKEQLARQIEELKKQMEMLDSDDEEQFDYAAISAIREHNHSGKTTAGDMGTEDTHELDDCEEKGKESKATSFTDNLKTEEASGFTIDGAMGTDTPGDHSGASDMQFLRRSKRGRAEDNDDPTKSAEGNESPSTDERPRRPSKRDTRMFI